MNMRNLFLLAATFAASLGVAPHAGAQDKRAIAFIADGAALRDSVKKPVTSFTGDLGFISASGNTNVQTLTIGDKFTYTHYRWMFSQLGTYVSGETDNKQTANQLRLAERVDYAFRPRVSVFIGEAYEQNKFAGFNTRNDEIVGVSWQAILAPHDSARLDFGGVLTQESDVDSTHQSYPSARAALSYKHQFSKLAYFHQFVEYLPNLQTSGSYRFNTESGARRADLDPCWDQDQLCHPVRLPPAAHIRNDGPAPDDGDTNSAISQLVSQRKPHPEIQSRPLLFGSKIVCPRRSGAGSDDRWRDHERKTGGSAGS